MKLIIQETINNLVEIEKLETIIRIADFDVGLRQMLEAEQSRTITADGDITLTDTDVVIQFIDPNGADRNINLPTPSINNHGFIIINTAAINTTKQLIVYSGVTELGRVPPNGGIGWFISSGLAWSKGGVGGHLQEEAKLCQGRLTLESGVPVSTSDQADKTNLYFTPYNGNLIDIYDGSGWQRHVFSELTLAVGGFTASKPYDIFIYDNAGTLTLEGVVWTNATTRATALTTQDGVLVLSGATNKRYLGTIYIDSEQKCQDTNRKRLVWNNYNQIARRLYIAESTLHTYNGGYRLWNNSEVNNRLEMICGVSGSISEIHVNIGSSAGAAGSFAVSALYVNGSFVINLTTNYNAQRVQGSGAYAFFVPSGYTYLNIYEYGNHAATTFVLAQTFGYIWA